MKFNQLVESFLNEKKLAKKDYDKDGKVESPKDEYMGSKDRAIKMAKGKKLKKKKK
jgi:hypothetical protein